MTKAKDVKVGNLIKTNWGRVMVVDRIEITKTKSGRGKYCFSGLYTVAPKWVIGKRTTEDRYENTKVDILKESK